MSSGPPQALLGVEVDLPGLAQGVGLDEVALVVHVEPVRDGVLLLLGDEAGDIDDGHSSPFGGGPACHATPACETWPAPSVPSLLIDAGLPPMEIAC